MALGGKLGKPHGLGTAKEDLPKKEVRDTDHTECCLLPSLPSL